jgi:anti-sigma B factor antagonist
VAPIDDGDAETHPVSGFESELDGSGVPVVHLFGELDIATVPCVEAEMEAVVTRADRRIVFDLAQVTFMDSSGIAMLLRAAASVGDVAVRNPSAVVLRVLEATGLTGILRVES